MLIFHSPKRKGEEERDFQLIIISSVVPIYILCEHYMVIKRVTQFLIHLFQTWNRQTSNTQAPSRPKPRTILPSTQKAPASFYLCPLNSCGSPVKGSDLVYHLQRHEGPLVQYFCKDSSTFLRFPVTRLTTITLSQVRTCSHTLTQVYFLQRHVVGLL